MKLTREQIKIIDHKTGPAIVVAGPGTGKTETLCQRIMDLVDKDCPPENIQVLTFSNVADKNIKDRLGDDGPYSQVRCSTFHSFGLSVIKENWREFGFTKKPTVVVDKYLGQEVDRIVSKIAAKRDVDQIVLKKAVVSACKKGSGGKINTKSALSKAISEAVKRFQTYKLINNLVDYDDMLNLVARLLDHDPNVEVKIAAKIDHLLVDELQDISGKEVNLIYNLAKHVRSTLLVGDKKQAIYKFRGSDLRCWDKLEEGLRKRFGSKLKHYYLTKSHRVPKQALGLVNAVAADICDDPPLTSDGQGYVPRLFIANSNDQQSAFVAKEINKLLAKGVDPQEIAILGRTRKTLYLMMSHLSHLDVEATEDYRKSRATTEKVLRALIRITRRIARDLDLKTIPPEKSWSRLIDYLDLPEEIGNEVYDKVMDNGWGSFWVPKKTGGTERLYRGVNNLRETVIKAAGLEPEAGTQLLIDALSRFIHHRFGKETPLIKRDLSRTTIAMMDYNTWDEVDLNTIPLAYTKAGVPLYTIHGAKGKEWSYVFLINVVDKYFPFYFNGKCDLDGELRLYYVAITRASKLVYVIHSPVIDTCFPNKRKSTKGEPKRGKQRIEFKNESPFISSYRDHMKQVK